MLDRGTPGEKVAWSLSGQDCSRVRALFRCSRQPAAEGTLLPTAGACVVPWGVEDFSLCQNKNSLQRRKG